MPASQGITAAHRDYRWFLAMTGHADAWLVINRQHDCDGCTGKVSDEAASMLSPAKESSWM